MTFEEINNRIVNAPDLLGTTGNERLWLSGLFDEFESNRYKHEVKARYILEELGFDSNSIDLIMNQ